MVVSYYGALDGHSIASFRMHARGQIEYAIKLMVIIIIMDSIIIYNV